MIATTATEMVVISAEARRGLRRLEARGGVGGEEAGEDRGDDGGEVGGVGPVVPGPGPLLGRDQADAGHEARNHARQDTASAMPDQPRTRNHDSSFRSSARAQCPVSSVGSRRRR